MLPGKGRESRAISPLFSFIEPYGEYLDSEQLFRIFSSVKSIINNISVLDATFSIGVDDKRVCESFIFDRGDGLNISKNNGISLFLG